jgi:hypothetical protein
LKPVSIPALCRKRNGAHRRSALVIVIDGECGHSWKLVLQQHKGITIIGVEAMRLTNEEYAEIDRALVELHGKIMNLKREARGTLVKYGRGRIPAHVHHHYLTSDRFRADLVEIEGLRNRS